LNRLQKISLYNMPSAARKIVIPIKEECNILILTGYNGVGKSRVLGALVELLSLARDVNYTDISDDWLMKLDFADEFTFRGCKINAQGRSKKKAFQAQVQKLLTVDLPLKEQYEKLDKAIFADRRAGSYSSKSSSDDVGSFCALYLNGPSDADQMEFVKSVKVVGFINEKVIFGVGRPEDDAVFDKEEVEGDLNKTLYVMIKDFVTTEAVKAGVEEDVGKFILEYLTSKDIKKPSAKDYKDVREFVASKMKDRKFVEDDSSIFSHHEMFVEVNKIFSLTSRKLVYVEGTLSVELKGGKLIPWPALSRGEKTLLALFLIVFLNRDGALFVLDEPDLSLHMEWQKMILPALLKLAPTCQFLVATHSPFLVMNTGSEQVVNMAKLVAEAI
jgi:predicted ATPase